MNKVSKKDYLIVGVISILTFVVVGYFAFWYTETREYNENNSIMTGYLLEIGEEEVINNLDNYILDNPNTVLYVSYGNDTSVKDFEKEFVDYINKENIKSLFIYIDLNRISDKNFINDFKNKFFSTDLKDKNVEINKQPNLFIFKNGKIENMMYFTKQNIKIADVKNYLEEQGVIEND